MSDDLPPDDTMNAPEAGPVSDTANAPKPFLQEDGIGLRLDDVCALLSEKNDAKVPKDDPILVAVTIHNAFLNEHARLFKLHEKALAAFMDEQAKAFSNGVQDQLKPLSSMLSDVTIQGIQNAVARFSNDLGGLRSLLLYCTAAQALSALLIVGALVWGRG